MNALEESTSTRDMENWFRDVGRTILLEALGDTYDRINSSFKTDFQSYSQDRLNLVTELETLRPIASQVQRLEDENAALKDEIKALKDTSREQIHASSHTSHGEAFRTPLAPRSTNQISSESSNRVDIEAVTHSELKAEFLRMEKKHAKLHNKFIDLQAALNKSNELVRERTATYRHWRDHAKQLNEQSLSRSRKIKKLEAQLAEISHEPLNSSVYSDAGDMEVVAEPTTLEPIHTPQPRQSNGPEQALIAVSGCQPRALARLEDNRIAGSPSLSRNIFESDRSGLTSESNHSRANETPSCLPPLPPCREFTDDELYIKPEPSSDTPVVVSERCVRKRKNANSDGGDIPASSRIKIEHSPEPQGTDRRRHFAPEESIDFDTEYRTVETPRKHARYQQVHDIHIDDDIGSHRRARNTGIAHLVDDIEQDSRISINDVSSTDLVAANRAELQVDTGPALQPLNNNQVLKPRLHLASSSRNRKSSARPRGIASLAEDRYQTESLNTAGSKNMSKASGLEQLLNTPSPARSDYPGENEESSTIYLKLPKRRELPFTKDGRKSSNSTSGAGPNDSGHKPASPSLNQDHDKTTPISRVDRGKVAGPTLRQTAKASLRLDDFKINPGANEGYDYAFTDVVRRKDDRACLQGCVKESCCGHKFRALAHAYRASTRPPEFQSLLESYLGDDCHRLSSMSNAEKETLWVEAKTRELANANGRHRHRYPRMPTPPGFWRADFPSTQEGEEYSEEAAKLEREIIDERHREAMRPGGLWVFRDE